MAGLWVRSHGHGEIQNFQRPQNGFQKDLVHERIACFVSARAVLHRATKMDLSDWDVSGVVSSVEGPSFGGSSARKSSTMRNPSSHVGGSSTQAEAFDAAEHERSIVAAIAHIRRLRSDVSAWSLTAESADGAHAASDPAPTRQATVPGATDACQLRTGTALECELHTRARASRTSRERAGIALSEAILRSIFRSVRQIPPPPNPPPPVCELLPPQNALAVVHASHSCCPPVPSQSPDCRLAHDERSRVLPSLKLAIRAALGRQVCPEEMELAYTPRRQRSGDRPSQQTIIRTVLDLRNLLQQPLPLPPIIVSPAQPASAAAAPSAAGSHAHGHRIGRGHVRCWCCKERFDEISQAECYSEHFRKKVRLGTLHTHAPPSFIGARRASALAPLPRGDEPLGTFTVPASGRGLGTGVWRGVRAVREGHRHHRGCQVRDDEG